MIGVSWYLMLLGLVFSGGAAAEERKSLKCKNPSGKLWSSIFNANCGQSVCKKSGKKANWQSCPKAATEENIEELKDLLLEMKKQIEQTCGMSVPGYINMCAYQWSTNFQNQTITYSKLTHSSTNIGGGIDIRTGIFTAPTSGDFLVTYSVQASDNTGDNEVSMYLMKNTVRIEESWTYSGYTGSSGWVGDQGGRTLILHLSKGETTSLYCADCSAWIYRITFCVSLTTPTSG